jgi:hypothetical protein
MYAGKLRLTSFHPYSLTPLISKKLTGSHGGNKEKSSQEDAENSREKSFEIWQRKRNFGRK